MQSSKEFGNFYLPLWLVWLLALLCVGIGLNSYPLLDNNEGLYAEIPREMLASGHWQDWIIPHLNGLAYMEKPPLLYWLTAISFTLFGEASWAARLVPALSALSCVGMLVWFGKKINRPETGKLASLMFASCMGAIIMSRTLMFDMLLTALLTAALMWIYLFIRDHDHKALRRSLVLLAFALLAKGFVAMILFASIAGGLTMALSASFPEFIQRCKSWLDWKAWGIFLAIVVPWHAVASIVEPNFAWFYFINEHVLRFMGEREPHDYYSGPWWYYLPRMLIFFMPWTFFAPVFAFATMHSKTERSLQIFLSLSWILPLLFFSISSAKANYYLIVVMPLACLQLALFLENRDFPRGRHRALPGAILAVLVGILVWKTWDHPLHQFRFHIVQRLPGNDKAQFLILGLIVVSVIVAGIFCLRPKFGAIAVAVISIFFVSALVPMMRVAAPVVSMQAMATLLQKNYPDRTVLLYKEFEKKSSLAFYLKKPVQIVDSASADLYWGNRLYENNIVLGDEQFTDLLKSQKVAILVMRRDRAEFLSKSYAHQFKAVKDRGYTTLFLSE